MRPATQDLFAAFRRLPAPFWVLAGGTFVNRFATMLVPFITLYLTRRGHSPSETGIPLLGYAVGSLLCGGIAGLLADRFGRNRVMAVALMTEALCVLAVGWAEEFWSIVWLMTAAGFAAQGAHPATSALVADIVGDRDRVAAQLALRVAINLGWSLGPATAGFVIAWADSYRPLFVADACTSAFMAVLSWFFLPRGSPAGKSGARWGPAWDAMRRSQPLLALLGGTLCVSFIFRQLVTTLNLHMLDFGYTEKEIGMLQALNGVIIICAEIPLTAATAAWSLRRGIMLGYLLFGAGMAANALGGALWLLISGMTIFTIGEMLALPRHAAWAQQLSPVEMRGRIAGLIGFGWQGGSLLGGQGGLMLYERSPVALWLLCGVLGVVAAWLLRKRGRGGES